MMLPFFTLRTRRSSKHQDCLRRPEPPRVGCIQTIIQRISITKPVCTACSTLESAHSLSPHSGSAFSVCSISTLSAHTVSCHYRPFAVKRLGNSERNVWYFRHAPCRRQGRIGEGRLKLSQQTTYESGRARLHDQRKVVSLTESVRQKTLAAA